MKRLTEAEFKATFNDPMISLGSDEIPACDLWAYFDSIPAADFWGSDCSVKEVGYVIRDATGRFDHVLLNSDDQNVFMVLVVDNEKGEVLGHRLLDLNIEYGLTTLH